MALFDVIGTPAWADVERVLSPAWRHYLRGLPGRAPTVYRRLGFAGTVCHELVVYVEADVERVLSPPWQHYLQGLPGRAPILKRRLGFAGPFLPGRLSEIQFGFGIAWVTSEEWMMRWMHWM
jgi:hypothetical protein